MSLLPDDFLDRCRGMHVAAQRRWGGRFLGRRVRLTDAGGTEAIGHRDYAIGDELRYVDWALCARHDELRVKQFGGRSDHTVTLLIDASLSMTFDSPSKFDAARRVAAALANLALANLDRVGVIAFGDSISAKLPPRRDAQHARRILEFLENLPAGDGVTDLRRVFQQFGRRNSGGGQAIVLSDLLDRAGVEPGLNELGRRHETYLIHVLSSDDLTPKWRGPSRLLDVERGDSLAISPTAADLANYRDVLAEYRAAVRRFSSRRGIGIAEIRADQPWQHALERIIQSSQPQAGIGA